MLYEVITGYGPAGVAFIVDVVTDNKNRSASDVRSTFSKRGGNLGADGAVAWMFNRKGLISIVAEGIDEDELMMTALEAGAEDVNRITSYNVCYTKLLRNL